MKSVTRRSEQMCKDTDHRGDHEAAAPLPRKRARGRYSRTLGLAIVLAITAGQGTVSQAGTGLQPAAAALTRPTVPNTIPGILVAADRSDDRQRSETSRAAYDPKEVYPGIFETNRLYRHIDGGVEENWVGQKSPALLGQVICSEAKARLNRHGSWTGNLKKDGTCGSIAEPADWALGNFLNHRFDANDSD